MLFMLFTVQKNFRDASGVEKCITGSRSLLKY